MANQKSFGRHICLEHRLGNSTKPITARQTTKPGPLAYSVERTFPVQKRPKTTTLDEELQQWKLARRQNMEIPWRALSLMATVCFGMASFVLPASVNDSFQWLLYILMAASMYAGFRKRRRQTRN